jgi:tRNA modification GTPase
VIPAEYFNGARTVVRVSARTGEGLLALRDAIHGFLLSRTVDADDFVLTNIRQNEAMLKAISALRAGIDAIERRVPHEMVLLDLYAALSALDEMTGDVAAEDILDRIFSSFCIGK